VAVVVAVGVLAFAAGALAGLANGDDDPTVAEPSPSATPSPTGTPSQEPTPSVTPSPSPSGPPVLADGRHFVLAERVRRAATAPTLEFDLAEFYTGEEANEVAEQRGDETPVPNDYYIVNDSSRLRRLPIAPGATVTYIPTDRCCEPVAGDLRAWIASVNGRRPGDYPPPAYTYWWIEVADGRIVAVEQQYLP
jgi:hypothetical protein